MRLILLNCMAPTICEVTHQHPGDPKSGSDRIRLHGDTSLKAAERLVVIGGRGWTKQPGAASQKQIVQRQIRCRKGVDATANIFN